MAPTVSSLGANFGEDEPQVLMFSILDPSSPIGTTHTDCVTHVYLSCLCVVHLREGGCVVS